MGIEVFIWGMRVGVLVQQSDGIAFHDLMTVGEKFNIKKRKKIFKKVQATLDAFLVYAKKNKVDRRLQVEVEKNRPRINEE